MRNLILFLFLLAGAVPATAAPGPRGLPEPVIPSPFGVNIHFTGDPKDDLNLLRSGGFRIVRMDLFWNRVERRRGVYDFTEYEALVTGLTRRSLRPLLILDYGNPLYDSPPGQTHAPHTPEGREAYARFCAAAAARFRGRGVIWELWNEPNGFWTPRPNPDQYASLALAAARAMRAADPQCLIVAPGVSGFAPEFLEHCFRQGLLQYLDAVSVHPYRDAPPETALVEFRQLRQLIDRHSTPGRQVPFLCSEWGYSAAAVPEERQGHFLARQWLTNLMAGSRLSIWYDWKNDGTDPKEREHHFGAVRHDLQPKPAYHAARTLTRELNGYRFVKRLVAERTDDFVMLLSRGEQQALALWTTGEPHDLLLPPGAVVFRRPTSTSTTRRSATPSRPPSIPELKAADWRGESLPLLPTPSGVRVPLSGAPLYLKLPAPSELLALHAAWQAELDSTSIDGAAPNGVRLSVSLRNPTTRRLPIAARIETPHMLEGRWTAPLPPAIGPKENLQFQWVGTWTLRSDEEVTVPVHTRIGPISGVETVAFEVRNALRPVLRRRSIGLDLLIHNRSRTAFSGELRTTVGERAVRRPVKLAEGEEATTVPLDRLPSDGLKGGLYDLRDQFILPVAIRRVLPIPVEQTDGKGWQVHVDGAPGIQPRDARLTVTEAPGTDPPFPRAVRCDFDLGRGWKFLRVTLPEPPPLDPEPKRLGMWVHGDGRGGSIRCRFTDSRGQTFQPAAGDAVTWTGWRWVSLPLDGRQAGFWGGPADGVVRGPVRWDTLFLFDPVGEAPRRGTLYFTGLTVEY